MESTEENIEFVYFSDIKPYKHLLIPIIKIGQIANPITCSAVMNNTTTNAVIINGGSNGYMFVFNYSTSNSTLLNSTCSLVGVSTTSNGGTGVHFSSLAVFKSKFPCPTVANASNDYLIYTCLGSSKMGIAYNFNPSFASPGPGIGSATSNSNWLTTGNTFTRTNQITIYNNVIYYTTLTSIGKATITDSTATGSVPTCVLNSDTYINSTTLSLAGTSVSSTYYPTGITTDSQGNLYTAMGNITALPVNSKILVFDSSGNYTKQINFSTVFTPTQYGYYYSIVIYNNILFVGTNVFTGSNWYTSTNGYIFAYDLTNNVLQLYSQSSNGPPCQLCVYSNSIYNSNLPALVSGPMNVVASYYVNNIYTSLNTFTGMYQKNYNNTGYTLDISTVSKYLS